MSASRLQAVGVLFHALPALGGVTGVVLFAESRLAGAAARDAGRLRVQLGRRQQRAGAGLVDALLSALVYERRSAEPPAIPCGERTGV